MPRQADVCLSQPGLQSEIQDSQSYIANPWLRGGKKIVECLVFLEKNCYWYNLSFFFNTWFYTQKLTHNDSELNINV